MGFGRGDYYVGQRKRRGAAMPVFLSVAVLAAAVVSFIMLRPTVRGTVIDAYSGEPLGGVTLVLRGQTATTDSRGRFTLEPVNEPAALVARPAPGHAGAEQPIKPGTHRNVTVALRPSVLSGAITHRATGAPLPGISVRAVNDAGATSSEAVTDGEGRYSLTGVPDDARLVVEGPGFARKEIAIGARAGFDLELRPDILTGVVRDPAGKAVPGVTVSMTGVSAVTGADGAYRLAAIPDEPRVVAHAPGYRRQAKDLGGGLTQDFTLEPLVVKGIYLTPESILKEDKFNALLALADRTEINAMVLDVKDETGWLYHDSKVPLAREIGAVHPSYDLRGRLKILKERGIYTIARIVCMQDPTLAQKRPELAVRNSTTGGIWENDNGVAWVNAMRPEVWDYNIQVAVEMAEMGFDEIQYDYVRFPSDGDMDAIDVGGDFSRKARTDAIHNFLAKTKGALAPYGVPLAADIFGITLWDEGDNGIGQQLEKIAAVVDYICPMIYPSHFSKGSLGFERPNDHPYEVLLQTLEAGGDRVPGVKTKLRPWLQDFSYGQGKKYGPDEIRAQIQATYDFGATGWLLWNANNTFTEAGLLPQ